MPTTLTCLFQKKTDVELSAEFEKYLSGQLIVNVSKTKEIVFHRPSAYFLLPPVLLSCLIGVTFCHNLKFNDHVKTFLLFVASDVTFLSALKVKASLLRSLIVLYFMLLLFHGSFTPYQPWGFPHC